jgi:hypothetical protein
MDRTAWKMIVAGVDDLTALVAAMVGRCRLTL